MCRIHHRGTPRGDDLSVVTPPENIHTLRGSAQPDFCAEIHAAGRSFRAAWSPVLRARTSFARSSTIGHCTLTCPLISFYGSMRTNHFSLGPNPMTRTGTFVVGSIR